MNRLNFLKSNPLQLDLQFFAADTGSTGPLNTTATINTGTGSVATKPAAFYDKTLLKALRQRKFDHERFAQKRPMPKNEGDTVNFRKFGTLKPALTPLTEGVTPEGSTATNTAISATTQQYGDYMYFSDRVNFQEVDPTLAEYSKEQGFQAGETTDILNREELNGGTNVFYAGGKIDRASLAVGDKPTINDFRKMVLTMKKSHVRPPSGAGGMYPVFITPEVEFDLMDDPKFEKAYEIGQNNKPFIQGEIATIYGMRFISLVNAKVFEGAGTEGVDVHSSVMIGDGAYGVTKIKGEGDVKVIVKGLGSSGTEDPLNQRQSIGWKINAYVVKRLEEQAIIRYESVPTNA